MKGYDIVEALELAEDKFVEEAGQENVKKSGNLHSWGYYASRAAAVCAVLLGLSSVTVMATEHFSSLKGDELEFESIEYRGDGIVAIQVRNDSDKTLRFQEDVKLCTFYGNQVIPQTGGDGIRMEGNVVAAHSSSEMLIDLSGAYDMKIANEPLTDDWYYLVLTNDSFVFGQDWQCGIDFQNSGQEEGTVVLASENEAGPREFEEITAENFANDTWVSPLEKLSVSAYFGTGEDGHYLDHIDLAGNLGDSVYAVSGGTIIETGFESKQGNYVILQPEDGVKVKYGHLKEISVEEGQEVKGGEVIGTIGKSGMATGPNLALTLYINDEAVNPLKDNY